MFALGSNEHESFSAGLLAVCEVCVGVRMVYSLQRHPYCRSCHNTTTYIENLAPRSFQDIKCHVSDVKGRKLITLLNAKVEARSNCCMRDGERLVVHFVCKGYMLLMAYPRWME